MSSKSLAAIILAGGESHRFGTDKAIYDFQGRPLVSHVLDVLSNLTTKIAMSVSPGNAELYRDLFGDFVNIVEDDEKYLGPLVGIKKALDVIQEEYVALAPCDMPFLSRELYVHLLSQIRENDAAIPIINGYYEPIIGVYRTVSLRKAVDKSISNGDKKLSSILMHLSFTELSEMQLKLAGIEKSAFININERP